MRFEHPNLLWLLLVIPPALAAFFWWSERVKKKLLTQFVESRLLAQLTTGLSPQRRKWKYILLIAAAALLIVAIARPQRGFDLEEVQQNGLDIVVAVDTSKSMLATDIAPNRLARAKLAALELMQTAKADRLGLVAFAGDAFLECPLTIDDTAFQQSVQALDVNTIPQGGTAIAAAINTALGTFKEKGNHRALVLFTDGEDNDEGALEAAQNAAKEGLKIFTVGIGSADGTLVTIADANGNSDYIRDEKGQVVKSHLNEQLLQQIAVGDRRILSAVARRGHHQHALRARPRAVAEIGEQRKNRAPVSRAIPVAAGGGDDFVDCGIFAAGADAEPAAGQNPKQQRQPL